jgi:HIV-1 Vpr-binding protein
MSVKCSYVEVADEDCSAASWQEIESYVVGTYHMWPLTSLMRQRILLQYLTPMGEYQEVCTHKHGT